MCKQKAFISFFTSYILIPSHFVLSILSNQHKTNNVLHWNALLYWFQTLFSNNNNNKRREKKNKSEKSLFVSSASYAI